MVCKALNYIFGFTSRLSEYARSKIRTGLYFVLFFVGLLYAASILDGVHLLIKCVIGAGLMGLIILFTVNGTVRPVKWNKPISIMWFGMGILQLISGIFVSMEYLPMAMIWLVAFPILFLVWNNRRDYIVLFREVAIAGNICFLFLSLTSVMFYPMNVLQYGGFVNNPNGVGQWVTFAFPLIVFLHYQEKNSQLKKWLYRAELALILLLCFLTKGRTVILAVGMMLTTLLVLRLVSNKNNFMYYVGRGGKFLLCIGLVWVLCLAVNLIPQVATNVSVQGPSSIVETTLTDGDPLEPSVDVPLSEETDFTQEQVPTVPAVQKTGVGEMLTNFINRMLGRDKANISLEDYSSGRIGIWLAVLEAVNLLGHSSRQHIITYRNGDVGSNVHNVILQWCYDNGLMAGLLFIIMMIWAWILLVRRSLHKGNLGDINSYMLIVHVGFACTAMFASVNLPFLYLISFLYYLSFAVLFDSENN